MRWRRTKFFAVCLMVLCCCIDPYNPSVISGEANFLVVEAFLNATENTCSVKLSRTIPLNDSEIHYESGALVILQDETGTQFPLVEKTDGNFLIENLTLNRSAKYTVKITTQDGEQYASEAVAIYKAALIDSITWNETRNGVAVDVNSHGNSSTTGYYYWKFTETWAYNSAFNSVLIPKGDTVEYRDTNDPNEAVYRCYMSENSNSILVGSSHALDEDIIQNFNLTNISWTSSKIALKYSVLVEQRTIDFQAYEYWQQLRKNTEDMGTIFDPLPFLPLSNLRCVTSPDKIVLGYFNASETFQQRIFIGRGKLDVPDGVFPVTGYENCSVIVKLFGEGFDSYLPIQFETTNNGGFAIPIGYQLAVPRCVDCRILGGTSIEPDYWE